MSYSLPVDPHGTSEKPIKCCVHVRSKTMHFRDDERPGLLHYSDVQTYWCGKTKDPHGPDGHCTSPVVCQSHRPCFAVQSQA